MVLQWYHSVKRWFSPRFSSCSCSYSCSYPYSLSRRAGLNEAGYNGRCRVTPERTCGAAPPRYNDAHPEWAEAQAAPVVRGNVSE